MKKLFLCAGSVIFLDQITKLTALACVTRSVAVLSFFRFELVLNRGISWGLLQGSNLLFMLVTGLIIALTGGLIVYSYKRALQGYAITGEMLVVAGSLSNIIDRCMHGGVVDFLVFHWNDVCWPAFNIADGAIVIGIASMALTHFISPEPPTVSEV